jgi:hypothetical protein
MAQRKSTPWSDTGGPAPPPTSAAAGPVTAAPAISSSGLPSAPRLERHPAPDAPEHQVVHQRDANRRRRCGHPTAWATLPCEGGLGIGFPPVLGPLVRDGGGPVPPRYSLFVVLLSSSPAAGPTPGAEARTAAAGPPGARRAAPPPGRRRSGRPLPAAARAAGGCRCRARRGPGKMPHQAHPDLARHAEVAGTPQLAAVASYRRIRATLARARHGDRHRLSGPGALTATSSGAVAHPRRTRPDFAASPLRRDLCRSPREVGSPVEKTRESGR